MFSQLAVGLDFVSVKIIFFNAYPTQKNLSISVSLELLPLSESIFYIIYPILKDISYVNYVVIYFFAYPGSPVCIRHSKYQEGIFSFPYNHHLTYWTDWGVCIYIFVCVCVCVCVRACVWCLSFSSLRFDTRHGGSVRTLHRELLA